MESQTAVIEEPSAKPKQITVTRTVTEKWKKSARENGAKAKDVVTSEAHREKLRAAWKTRERVEPPCNCGRDDGTHAYKCTAYAAWKKRESRAKEARQLAQPIQEILPQEGDRSA